MNLKLTKIVNRMIFRIYIRFVWKAIALFLLIVLIYACSGLRYKRYDKNNVKSKSVVDTLQKSSTFIKRNSETSILNTFYGDSINYTALGNSITLGAGSTPIFSYSDIINYKVKFKSYTKLAISGAVVMPYLNLPAFNREVENIPVGTNLITIMIGVNDCIVQNPIGDISSVISKTYVALNQNLSFVEAFRFNLETIKRNFPNAKIFIITPCQNWATNHANLKYYIDAEIAIANSLSISVIDAYSNSGIWENGNKFADDVHPNNSGHELLSDYVLMNIISNSSGTKVQTLDQILKIGNESSIGAKFGGELTSNSFIKNGGTSSSFLKADGSVDNNNYLTSQNISSGTFKPIINNLINIISNSVNNAYFSKNGNIIHIMLNGTIIPTGSGQVEMMISLPFSTTNLSQGELGVATIGLNSGTLYLNGIVSSYDERNVLLKYFSPDSNIYKFTLQFDYSLN